MEENPLDPGLPFLDVEFICVPGFSLVGKAISGRNLGCHARWLRIRGATLYKTLSYVRDPAGVAPVHLERLHDLQAEPLILALVSRESSKRMPRSCMSRGAIEMRNWALFCVAIMDKDELVKAIGKSA